MPAGPASAHDTIQALDRAARITRTETARGHAVWREWGAGKPLVFFHGGAGSWLHFVHQIEPFAAERRVIAVDLPGLGDACENDRRMDIDALVDIVETGLDEILGTEPFDLVGFSFGTIVGGCLAEAIPSRISSFTMAAAVGLGLPFRTVQLSRWRDLEHPEARRDVHRENLAALMIADRDRIDDLAVAIQAHNALRSRLDTRAIAHTEPLADGLKNSEVPLATIWGARDQLCGHALEARRQWLADRDPDAPFAVIPDAGHWVQYEAPEAFNQILRECIAAASERCNRTEVKGGDNGR